MAKDEININQLASELEIRSRVYYRLMLRRSDTAWTLQAMIADAGSAPTAPFNYNYGHIAFVGGATSGARLSSWLLRLKGKAHNFSFIIPKLQEKVFTDRYPSHTEHDFLFRLQQPYSIHRLHISGRGNYPRDYQPLVKSGCPSFPSLSAAAYELLYERKYKPGQAEPDDITIRIAHTEAWIELVHLHLSTASITVVGTDVGGTRLEVSAEPHARFELTLRKAGVRRFSFPSGLPSRLFIILSQGDRWLDYRDLDLQGRTRAIGSNVVVQPSDDCAQVEGLIARGESETREFKQIISNDKKNTFLKTVAAFANGEGGVILFGVADSAGEVIGIKGNIHEEKVRIVNMIRDNVVQRPNFRIVSCKLKGKQVIALFIAKGVVPPYGLDAAKPHFYIRRGATTYPASQAEIRASARSNDSRPDTYPFGLNDMGMDFE